MSVAATIRPLIHGLLGPDLPIRVTCWDGSSLGPSDAPAELRLVRRRALRRLLWAPNELGLARAYVSGDAEIRGDIMAGLEALEAVSDPDYGPTMHIDAVTKRNVAVAALRLGIIGAPPTPPPEEIALRGRRHSKAVTRRRSRTTTTSATTSTGSCWGESMTYSCAYFEQEPSDAVRAGRGAAGQVRPRRPQARPSRRGCASSTSGAGGGRSPSGPRAAPRRASVGITLSHEQADHARRRAAEAGLADRVEIRIQDYRDVADGPFDAIASIGMAEHVGEEPARGVRAHAVRAARAPGPAAQPRDLRAARARGYRALPDLVHRQVRVPRRRAASTSATMVTRSRPPASRCATSSRCASTTG